MALSLSLAISVSRLTEFASSGRSAAGNFQFSIALQHHPDGFTAGFLGNLRGIDTPAIDAEFAAKASANVVLMHVDVGFRNL